MQCIVISMSSCLLCLSLSLFTYFVTPAGLQTANLTKFGTFRGAYTHTGTFGGYHTHIPLPPTDKFLWVPVGPIPHPCTDE